MGHTCEACGKTCSTPQALGSHRRYRHPDGAAAAAAGPEAPQPGPNRRAVEVTLAEVERLGHLETIDTAVVVTLRSLATAVDRWPEEAPLWRQYREALREVLHADRRASDELEEALEAIRGATTVGDSPAA